MAVLKVLLARGSRLEATAADGRTALDVCAFDPRNGFACMMLLEAGAVAHEAVLTESATLSEQYLAFKSKADAAAKEQM